MSREQREAGMVLRRHGSNRYQNGTPALGMTWWLKEKGTGRETSYFDMHFFEPKSSINWLAGCGTLYHVIVALCAMVCLHFCNTFHCSKVFIAHCNSLILCILSYRIASGWPHCLISYQAVHFDFIHEECLAYPCRFFWVLLWDISTLLLI